MKSLIPKFIGFLSRHIGTYYFLEVEEKATEFGQVGLRKYRLVVRAMSTKAALAAAQSYAFKCKQRDGKDYELSFIQRV